jgi:D-apiose dehydrogenase
MIRFCYVGLGQVTLGLHLPAMQRISGAKVLGGCDTCPERRAIWQELTGTPAYDDLDKLLTDVQPDVLVVATPPDSHMSACLAAFRHGTHVICEKPFTATVEEATRVLSAAREAGRQIAVNHHFRYQPIFRSIIERVGAGLDGRLVFCQVWQLMNAPPRADPVAWRAAMSDRTLLEGGVHLIDLLVCLYGTAPSTVYASHAASLDTNSPDDAIQLVSLGFADGRLAQLTIDRLCPAATRYAELRVDCERASLRASVGGRLVVRLGKERANRAGVRLDVAAGGLAWSEHGLRRRVLARNPRRASTIATARLIQEAVRAFQAGCEPPSSGQEALRGLQIIEAAYKSARTGARTALTMTDQEAR